MLELIVKNEPFNQLPKRIDFNFDELKSELAQKLETYDNRVFTPETIGEAKEDRAKLNKLSEAIDTRRKEIKNVWNAPCLEFEKKIKALTEMIEKPKNAIDRQIKAFEESEKSRKKDEIESYFTSVRGELPIEFVSVFQSEWLNKTFSMDKIRKSIDDTIAGFRNGIEVIENLNSPYEAHIKQLFFESLDLAASISDGKRLGEKLSELESKKADTPPVQYVEIDQPVEPIVQIIDIPPVTHTVVSELEAIDLRIYVTAEQKAALRQFLKANNIRYDSIPSSQKEEVYS